MCQTTLDIILVYEKSLAGTCCNDGNGVECKCGDMYNHQSYIYININFKSNFDY